jgi:DNA invertase Pin-like site-specific DNA recombinase
MSDSQGSTTLPLRQGAEPATRVAVYSRYSTDRQDARSIDDQVRRCRQFAVARGYEIVDEYADAAISGAHTERQNLQRLLADARRRAFRHVLVDDLSRLSRDLGDAWRLVFSDFASHNVSVVDVTTGISSDAQGARMTFGAMALISDGFLQMIRTETHRGLEGRALAGFATGGKTYGFSTVPEENPQQPEHPRKVRVIYPTEAAVVRRIFEMYVAGTSLKGIAGHLNAEGVRAPHDNGRGNKIARGWGHTTIFSMLKNEQYVGVWVWNKEKWVPIPGTSRYRRIPRPPSEHVRKEIPELRIVPADLWARAQARRGTRPRGAGRPPGTGKTTTLLSGLLRCGVCGGSFVIVSRRYGGGDKAGKAGYANYGCAANRSRGDTICANARTVSERKLVSGVVAELKEQLSRPDLLSRFAETFTKRFDEVVRGTDGELRDLDRQIERASARLKNVTAAMAAAGFSEALLAQLKIEEQAVAALKARRATAAKDTRPKVLPHPRVIQTYLARLWDALDRDTARARDLLARHMPPLVLTPHGRSYRVTGGFNLALCLEEDPVAGAAPAESLIMQVGGTGIEPATRSV